MTNWQDLPEVNYQQLGDSCIIGDVMCYHPIDTNAFCETVVKKVYSEMAKASTDSLYWVGMAKGYIQAKLGKILPKEVRLLLWDPHPNLTKILLGPKEREAIEKRWTVIHTAREFHKYALDEPAGTRRMPYVQPGLNEIVHWPLGFIDWFNRNRKAFRAQDPLKMYPSDRSIKRIGRFGDIPGIHQIDKLGNRDAIVVSQGPSLDASMEAIRLAIQRGAVVFSAAQACRKLNEAGIVPHFSVVADPSDAMHTHSRGVKCGAFIIESMASEHFYLEEEFKGRLIYFQIMSSHCHQAAADLLGWPAFDDSFATVTEIATQIAVQALGAKRVYMFGCDFGAPPGTESNPWPQYQSSFKVPTYDGTYVWTNAHYNHARHWCEFFLEDAPGALHRYSTSLPVKGEVRLEAPEQMLETMHKAKPYSFTMPKARESDILCKMQILAYLKKKGLDLDNAINPTHGEDFRYAFSPLSHDRKLSSISAVMSEVMLEAPSDPESML